MKTHHIPQSFIQKKGTIDFPGNIVIDGEVRGEITLKAKGDISIRSSADVFNIEAGGSVNIGGVAKGLKSGKLIAGGDVRVRSLDRVFLTCEESLYVAQRIDNCDIKILGQVVAPNVVLVDSKISALGGIILGTANCTHRHATALFAGISYKDLEKSADLDSHISKRKEDMQHLLNSIGPMLKKALRDPVYGRKIGTDIDVEMSRINNFKAEIIQLEEQMTESLDNKASGLPVISIHKGVQSGVELTLNSGFKRVVDNINNPVSFTVHDDNSSIIINEGVTLNNE